MACGYDTELFYSPYFPQGDPIHLYVRKTDTFVTVSQDATVTFDEHAIDLDVYVNDEKLFEQKEKLDFDSKLKGDLLERAIDGLRANKVLHDELETNYVPYIHFRELTQAFLALLP